jgi:hypothetical protein
MKGHQFLICLEEKRRTSHHRPTKDGDEPKHAMSHIGQGFNRNDKNIALLFHSFIHSEEVLAEDFLDESCGLHPYQ